MVRPAWDPVQASAGVPSGLEVHVVCVGVADRPTDLDPQGQRLGHLSLVAAQLQHLGKRFICKCKDRRLVGTVVSHGFVPIAVGSAPS